MLCPRPIKVKPLENYMLLLHFDNGEKKIFDVSPYLSGEWYGKLRDKTNFNTVHILNKHIEWNGGQDIAPHELYENSLLISDELI